MTDNKGYGEYYPKQFLPDGRIDFVRAEGMNIVGSGDGEIVFAHYGVGLRDHFATTALQGLLADDGWNRFTRKEIAAESYAYADAMLKARMREDE